MQRLACFFLFIFASHAWAEHYLYAEGGRWHVNVISMDAAGWPQLDEAHSFNTEAQARAFVHSAGEKAAPLNVAKPGPELRGRAGSELWSVTNQWDWEWEIKFGQWVSAELHTGWWKNYGLATDCADVVYTARWIFARMNGLPMANSLASGQWFSHRSVKPEWETLPTDPEWFKDQKFLAALNYLESVTYTHTLWNDSYPSAINARALIPGAYHLHLTNESGHTLLVHSVGLQPDDVPVTVLYSNIPSEVRELWAAVFLDQESDASGNGFVHMRWPQWAGEVVSLVPATQMPNYSLEQFAPNFIRPPRSAFWQEVFFRLNPRANFEKIATKTLQQILDSFHARVPVVVKGWAVCSVTPCVQGSPEWELWSTPSRDGRLMGNINVFDELAVQIGDMSKFMTLLNKKVVTVGGQTLNLHQTIEVWRNGGYSSDPNEPPEVRWGI
jgi:hypothetical protein